VYSNNTRTVRAINGFLKEHLLFYAVETRCIAERSGVATVGKSMLLLLVFTGIVSFGVSADLCRRPRWILASLSESLQMPSLESRRVILRISSLLNIGSELGRVVGETSALVMGID
jgi:hypothetical protein